MNWKCPSCGNEESLTGELRCSCGNEIVPDQLHQLHFEKASQKPLTSPSLRNSLIVIAINLALSAVTIPLENLLPSTVNNFINHQTSIIGYLFILWRIKVNLLQIWKVAAWVWLLYGSICTLVFFSDIGTKYTANGIIWGGLKSETISVLVALLFYRCVVRNAGMANQRQDRP